MTVNKKITIVILLMLTASAVLSGCTSEEKTEQIAPILKNESPVAIISTSGTIASAPDYVDLTMIDAVAYAGDVVTFDASGSYDSDGEIVSYGWIWEDNSDSQGITATRQFYIDNVFDLQGLPLIFSIILNIEDNDQSTINGKDGVIASFGKLRTIQELKYQLEEPLFLQPCSWNATIYLEKSFLSAANKITIMLYDDEGNEIAQKDEDLGFISLWKEKTIKTTGSLNTTNSFKSATLIVYGFSLRESIHILYGGEKASYIGFDFTI